MSSVEFDEIASVVRRTIWETLHPRVAELARSRFESRHYADAVEAVLKELNSGIKTVVLEKTGEELDGAKLMNRAFSVNEPIFKLGDLDTGTGKNIQQGYMQIFSGTMTGIRNPKAHDNIVISEVEGLHLLYLASLLMFKIDKSEY